MRLRESLHLLQAEPRCLVIRMRENQLVEALRRGFVDECTDLLERDVAGREPDTPLLDERHDVTRLIHQLAVAQDADSFRFSLQPARLGEEPSPEAKSGPM